LAGLSAVVSFGAGVYTAWYASKDRRRVSVLVHRAFFIGREPRPFYFIKITNLSRRDIEITHVWFATNPPVYVLLAERPLPTRLQPDETWEAWVDAEKLEGISNVERSGRARLANGRTVKSRPNKHVPPVGYVAGQGTRGSRGPGEPLGESAI
jgi:hypothetical protein